MKETSFRTTLRSVFVAVFAAIICIGCFISIPVGQVPITIQNMFAVLAGSILGGFQGAGAVGLFIILGGLGVPVFSGAAGGPAILFGPTGGYIWGYFIAAFIGGILLGTPHTYEKKFNVKMWVKIALVTLLSYAAIYLPGIPWFRHVVLSNPENSLHNILDSLPVKEQWAKVIAWTVTPYLPGDFLKWIITIPLTAVLRPVAARYLYPNDKKEEEELIKALKEKK